MTELGAQNKHRTGDNFGCENRARERMSSGRRNSAWQQKVLVGHKNKAQKRLTYARKNKASQIHP